MSFGHPTCEKARKIAKSYENYPVTAWRKLFQEVSNTLREDEEADLQEEKPTAEHRTTVINDGPQLRITVAENSKI